MSQLSDNEQLLDDDVDDNPIRYSTMSDVPFSQVFSTIKPIVEHEQYDPSCSDGSVVCDNIHTLIDMIEVPCTNKPHNFNATFLIPIEEDSKPKSEEECKEQTLGVFDKYIKYQQELEYVTNVGYKMDRKTAEYYVKQKLKSITELNYYQGYTCFISVFLKINQIITNLKFKNNQAANDYYEVLKGLLAGETIDTEKGTKRARDLYKSFVQSIRPIFLLNEFKTDLDYFSKEDQDLFNSYNEYHLDWEDLMSQTALEPLVKPIKHMMTVASKINPRMGFIFENSMSIVDKLLYAIYANINSCVYNMELIDTERFEMSEKDSMEDDEDE